jgi:hypothetical protein
LHHENRKYILDEDHRRNEDIIDKLKMKSPIDYIISEEMEGTHQQNAYRKN